MSRGWWWGMAAFGASALGAVALFYGVAGLARDGAPAESSAFGPTTRRARRSFMTPRALALASTERRTTMA